jgi:phosphatidylglycerol:prolipoprotein diacylglycerol transferase
MHPILFKVGFLTIHTYGLLVAMGLLAALWTGTRLAKARQISSDRVMDLTFYAVLAGFVGARLLYVILNPSFFRNDWLGVLRVWEGGLVFYGGFIGALAAILFYIRRQQLPPGVIFDILAVAAPLGHAIGRIGCFFAGCCYGGVCDLPWAVTFTDPMTLAPPDIPLHPTQLYESAANFLIFAFLLTLYRKGLFPGRLFLVYMLVYGMVRSGIEIFRNDSRGFLFDGMLSTSQAVGLTAALVAAVLLVALHFRDKRQTR